MQLYSLLRQFADSWGLLFMVVIFLGVLLHTFRPGSKALHSELASLPLRDVEPQPSPAITEKDRWS